MQHRLTGWDLLRAAALPRLAPAVVLAAWMVAAASGADRPWAGSLAGVAAAATLLVADRAPLLPLVAAPVGLSIADGAGGIVRDDPWLTLIAVACFCVGRFGRRRHQYAVAAVVVLLVVANVADRGLEVSVGDVVFPVLFTAAPWLLGLALQAAVRRAEASARHAATVLASSAAAVDRAAAEERLRIARDLHDVVAHNISALSLQAQTARRRAEIGHPVALEELRAIEHAAQSAMTDLRRLLGVLRPTPGIEVAGPHEGLAQLAALVETARRVGQRVAVRRRGEERDLPPALSLAAYRILQESLANARKHAPEAAVTVDIDWSTEVLALTVANPSPPAPCGQGAGVAGMAERARLHGGDVEAGREGAAWVVRARLPLPAVVGRAS